MLKIAALCMLAWCQTIAAAQLVSAVVYNTSVPPHAKLPIYDHGYLIVTYGHGDSAITAYGPDGSRIFDGLVKLPSNAPLEIGNAAADTDGTVAVTVTYTGPEGHGGAIVLFNRIGHQTHVIETGRYLPAALAFDSHRDLWAAGWQRGTQDYFIFRKFSPTGTEAGAFVRRSAFPAGLEPGHIPLGEKGVSVADGRVGALLESGNSADAREWVELDLAGKLVGRWPMPHMFGINVAFASDGNLYGDTPYAKGKPVHLTLFDRSSGAWKTVPDEIHADWTLMGAQGSDVVVWDRGSDPMLLRCWRPSR
ncbi:MAG TPA: hypothetical protein VMI94_03130 [Bryobacteraceae bacterium]|nr:hypothetical protein [Bryobacteraceae bacterium]